MVKVETAKVYRGGRRRYLTLKAAVKAEAVAAIKARYPSEKPHYGRDGRTEDPGFHWSQLPRSDVMLRRLCRLVAVSAPGAVEGGI